MQYEWWYGAREHLRRAGVEPWEVMEVLYSPTRWPRPARTPENLPVLTVWGRTEEGRPIVVLLRQPPSAPGTWEVVMAAPMRPLQLREYEAWEAQR
ncbi:hypothetical protein OG225_21370 [Nocardia sp. NBC_01377]|uniref:hypothetical protein n=1 Tax=Nocardia sp. NBC_01377 TaxID=2903595 RepID=UPI00324E5A00